MRYLVNDLTRMDERARLTAEKIATLTSELVVPKKQYIEATGVNELKILAGTIITVGKSIFILDADKVLNASNLDAGVFEDGNDYYIYCCDRGGKNDEEYKISLNSTYPAGYNASNSRKIGGFHYGICRRENDRDPVNGSGVVFGAGWETEVFMGILKYSVWTTHHRPKSEPEGMVYVGNGLWADIYLTSLASGRARSVKGVLPATGTEGHHWYSFNELLMKVSKRLPSYAEWARIAHGSPRGENNNDMAWTASANTARVATGTVVNAVSACGAKDCVGNVLEWLSDLLTRPAETGAWGWENAQSFTYNGRSIPKGSLYLYYADGLAALSAGGFWFYTATAGPLCVNAYYYPWYASSSRGVRAVSDSL